MSWSVGTLDTSQWRNCGGAGGSIAPPIYNSCPPSLENDLFHEANSNSRKSYAKDGQMVKKLCERWSRSSMLVVNIRFDD